MNKIYSVFIILGLLFVSQSFSSPSNDNDNVSMDDIHRKKIIGKWTEINTPYYGISSFEVGGIYNAWVYENPKKEKLLYSAKGKWWIEKGKLYNTVSEISPPIPELDTADIAIDIIVNISEDEMTLIDEKGLKYINKRVKE